VRQAAAATVADVPLDPALGQKQPDSPIPDLFLDLALKQQQWRPESPIPDLALKQQQWQLESPISDLLLEPSRTRRSLANVFRSAREAGDRLESWIRGFPGS
jgi:hypothetical protein